MGARFAGMTYVMPTHKPSLPGAKRIGKPFSWVSFLAVLVGKGATVFMLQVFRLTIKRTFKFLR